MPKINVKQVHDCVVSIYECALTHGQESHTFKRVDYFIVQFWKVVETTVDNEDYKRVELDTLLFNKFIECFWVTLQRHLTHSYQDGCN